MGVDTKTMPKLPLLLLFATLSGMGISAWITFHLGDKALQGVAQPATNPVQKLFDQTSPIAGESKPLVKFQPLDATKVEKEVRVYIQQQQKKQRPPQPSASKS
ncbi:hypothetical protein [Synechocystis sp. LKSZ1]|uniref:hypothetical protein n=1 Tax=Synechocystis sp. LKSZ1 TaxID=3144951 RepID=UPI00336BBFD8